MRCYPEKSERLKRARGYFPSSGIYLGDAMRVCGEGIILKTLFPGRKYTKMFERGALP